jgi:DNA-binding response OmpR family regulator
MLLQAETHPSYVADVIPSDADLESLEDLAEHAGVELVTWPADEHRRQSLARAGVPRLLLVSPEADAPTGLGLDEDWVRLPADVGDVVSRLKRLGRVLEQLQHDHPVIDANHIVRFGGTSVLLSPAQAALVTALLEHPGHVIERGRLEAMVWPDGAPGPKALDGVVFRLRRRLQGLGLVIRSAQARGFALDANEPGSVRTNVG